MHWQIKSKTWWYPFIFRDSEVMGALWSFGCLKCSLLLLTRAGTLTAPHSCQRVSWHEIYFTQFHLVKGETLTFPEGILYHISSICSWQWYELSTRYGCTFLLTGKAHVSLRLNISETCMFDEINFTSGVKRDVQGTCSWWQLSYGHPHSPRPAKREQGSPAFLSAGLWAVLSPPTGPFWHFPASPLNAAASSA